MDFNAEEVFAFAVDLAKRAGDIIKEGFYADKSVEIKTSSIDLVTEYDRKVEAFVFDDIRKRYPSHRLIGEESTADSSSARNALTDDPTWIVDPIDGTLNFVHEFPSVCISIGITVGRKPVIGVIFNPILNHLYAAREGCGATLNGRLLKTSKQTDMNAALVFLELGYSKDPEKLAQVHGNFQKFLPKIHGLRCLGAAALQLAMVAQGGADAYVNFGIHVWDIAAGVIIVREAGGVVIDTEGGDLDIMSRRFLCAATPELAEKFRAELLQYTPLPRDD